MKFLINRASDVESMPTDKASPIPPVDDGMYQWEIEITSLGELLALIEEEGRLIIGRAPEIERMCITIYDFYIE